MHELSICTALLEEVGRIAREHRARQVCAIIVRIGPLAGVEPELLRRAYPIASAGTLAEGADLVLEEAAVRVRCLACGVESTVTVNDLSCPACRGWRTQLLSGEELLLMRVELTREEESTCDV